MIFEDFCYVELVLERLTNRNKIVTLSEVKGLVDVSSKKDCYRSYYRHPVEFKEYVAKNGTVAGWDGEVYTDYLWIDIDRADLSEALDTTRYMLGRLETSYEIPRKTIPTYFSGCKGFHIGINAKLFNLMPSRSVPSQCKALAALFADDVDIDLAIYDRVRIFRLSNTINTKSGLYKVPLTIAEIDNMSIDEIKTLARAPKTVAIENDIDIGSLAYMLDKVKPTAAVKSFGSVPHIKKKNLHGTKLCIWQLLHGVGEGCRDEAAVRLVVDYAKKGMPVEVTMSLIRAWNEHNRPPLDDNILQSKVASVYGSKVYDYGCNDELLTKFCHEDCYLFRNKEQAKEPISVYSLEELEEPYIEYVKGANKTKIQFPFLPNINKVIRGLRPGEVCIVMARPGIGKSLFAQTLIHAVVQEQGIPGILFSIEMPKEQVFERAASIESLYSPTEVEQMYLAEDHDQVSEAITGIKNLYIVDKANISLADIQEVIENINHLGLIAIDYMSLVRAPGNSLYERTSYVARQLKTLAKESNAAVLMLSQVSRKAGDGTIPITLEHGRDSGAIEEGADFLMGMWRDEIENKIIHVQLLKGRRGGAGNSDKLTFANDSVKLASAVREEQV